MRKQLRFSAVMAVLLMLSVVDGVYADGYENLETVGGVLNPINFIMTLSTALFLCIAIFGIIVTFVLIRIGRTDDLRMHENKDSQA